MNKYVGTWEIKCWPGCGCCADQRVGTIKKNIFVLQLFFHHAVRQKFLLVPTWNVFRTTSKRSPQTTKRSERTVIATVTVQHKAKII